MARTSNQRAGFSRLRAAGWTDEDIEVFRAQFHARRIAEDPDAPEPGTSCDRSRGSISRAIREDDEQLRRMEEEYLTSMMDAEQGTLDRMALANDLNFGMTTSEGSNVDLLWGMLMGFLLGVIMLFLVRSTGFLTVLILAV